LEKIELLDTLLLDDVAKLQEIDHWLQVLNWGNGWHYDLDIIWLLNHLEQLDLPRGGTIVDAGAGLGVMQFILASRGYNVISLDFGKRSIPKYAKGIFNIECIDGDLGSYTHEYMEFMTFGQNSIKKKSIPTTSIVKDYMSRPSKIVYYITNKIRQRYNTHYVNELRRDHAGFGKITFVRGTFNSMPIEDNTADALISISAFEHNTFEDMPDSIREFKRVIKPGTYMMVTTSAVKDKDWYHEPSKGWNLTQQTLSKWFGITDNISYNYDFVARNIKNCKKLKDRISAYYKYAPESGLPYGDLKKAKYIPVGIVKQKS
jgi:ubiquinone/menaquinone biosynthesis C-methylase UbiE